MKKSALILLALCLALSVVSMASCGKDEEKPYEDHEVTNGTFPIDESEETEPEEESESSNDAYINAAPANDEPGWGALQPRPGK